MADEHDVVEVLVEEDVGDVGDVRLEVDVGRQQVRALAQAGERRRVHVVALRRAGAGPDPGSTTRRAPSRARVRTSPSVSAFAVPGTCRDTLARNGFLAGTSRSESPRSPRTSAPRTAELLGGERTREADDGQDEDHLAVGREDRCGDGRDRILGVVAAGEERVLVERELDEDLVELVMASGVVGCARGPHQRRRADGASRCRAPRRTRGRAPVRVPPRYCRRSAAESLRPARSR